MRTLEYKQRGEVPHWVGDGFPVRTIFNYNDLGQSISPFLLMDYAGPAEFDPTEGHRRGVGEHPHRGFETVTIVYSGEVEHRDSSGGGGIIGPGDVQWMTAASGLVHEEKHGPQFSKTGGAFEMVQLWVNLPSKHKMSPPRYQGIKSHEIPVMKINDSGGSLRVIAGSYKELIGPAKTFSDMNVWDLGLPKGATFQAQLPRDWTVAVFVLNGALSINQGARIASAEIGVFAGDSDQLEVFADENTRALVLSGKPLNEPIVGYGPFVMNTSTEIREAFDDYNSGKMGKLKASP